MKTTEVRPTVPSDLDSLGAALLEVHALDGYPVEGADSPKDWVAVANPLGQWTALLNQEPVGHAALMSVSAKDVAPRLLMDRDDIPLDRMAVLARVFVAPAARGNRLARQLVSAAHVAANTMSRRLVLDVMRKDQSAIALYSSLGWEILGPFEYKYSMGASAPALAMAAPPQADWVR